MSPLTFAYIQPARIEQVTCSGGSDLDAAAVSVFCMKLTVPGEKMHKFQILISEKRLTNINVCDQLLTHISLNTEN